MKYFLKLDDMTQEDKNLLLIDLSARLPYNVKVDITYNKEHGSSDRLHICSEGCLILNTDVLGLCVEDEIYLKPYLRPMSSMTEEEWEYLRLLKNELVDCDETNDEKFNRILNDIKEFYYSRHIDRNGLIPKGLALEAPKDMYNLKEK